VVSSIAMTVAIDNLPDDPVALKALLVDQQKKIKGLQSQIDSLHESLRLQQYRKYAASSEKAPGQQELFDEADQVELEDEVIEQEIAHTTSASKHKKTNPESHCPQNYRESSRSLNSNRFNASVRVVVS